MGDNKGIKKDNTRKRNAKADYNARHSEEIEQCNRIFIERLKSAREAKQLTQKETAEKLDISLATYRKYEQETGNRSDISYFIGTLANTLDVSADYLIGKSNTPHPEYDDVIKTTGLNDKSIQQLQKLHALDGDEIHQGYIDFINCFLGNEECTSIFFEGLLPILRNLNDAISGDYPSERMKNLASTELADHLYDYITKVVVPTYSQKYKTGEYTPADVDQYLTSNTMSPKKKEDKS